YDRNFFIDRTVKAFAVICPNPQIECGHRGFRCIGGCSIAIRRRAKFIVNEQGIGLVLLVDTADPIAMTAYSHDFNLTTLERPGLRRRGGTRRESRKELAAGGFHDEIMLSGSRYSPARRVRSGREHPRCESRPQAAKRRRGSLGASTPSCPSGARARRASR